MKKLLFLQFMNLKKNFHIGLKIIIKLLKKNQKNFLKKIIEFIEEQNNKIKIEQFYKLYKDLLIIYFQCELSTPSIEIDFNFKINEDFNDKTMIDYSKNKGKKKVNFVFFPSLKSNGNYLQNGKQWVFTYNENKTFFLKNIELEPLIDINNKFYIPTLKDKLKLNIKKEFKKEFIFYLKNKNNLKERKNKSDSSIIIEENEKLIECKLFLNYMYNLSSP